MLAVRNGNMIVRARYTEPLKVIHSEAVVEIVGVDAVYEEEYYKERDIEIKY